MQRTRVVVYLDIAVDRAVEIEAAKQNIDKRELVERALRAYLELEAA
jgi:hypothetical protein